VGVGNSLVSVFGRLIADQSKNSPYDVSNDVLSGLRRDKLPADLLNATKELIDVGPFVSGYNLEKNMGGRSGAGF
jgi:hypothetical protein